MDLESMDDEQPLGDHVRQTVPYLPQNRRQHKYARNGEDLKSHTEISNVLDMRG